MFGVKIRNNATVKFANHHEKPCTWQKKENLHKKALNKNGWLKFYEDIQFGSFFQYSIQLTPNFLIFT